MLPGLVLLPLLPTTPAHVFFVRLTRATMTSSSVKKMSWDRVQAHALSGDPSPWVIHPSTPRRRAARMPALYIHGFLYELSSCMVPLAHLTMVWLCFAWLCVSRAVLSNDGRHGESLVYNESNSSPLHILRRSSIFGDHFSFENLFLYTIKPTQTHRIHESHTPIAISVCITFERRLTVIPYLVMFGTGSNLSLNVSPDDAAGKTFGMW